MITHLLRITALFAFASTALASHTVNIDTKYYAIYGTSAGELRREMNSKSPITQSGKTYDAYTTWYINWRFNWNTNGEQCKITKVTSTVDVKFTFPKWINRNDSNNTLKSEWDSYYKALTRHENGHKQFGVEAAEEIEGKLMQLSSSSCQALEEKANAVGKQILDKYISLEKKYDEETNHGMNDGAIFP